MQKIAWSLLACLALGAYGVTAAGAMASDVAGAPVGAAEAEAATLSPVGWAGGPRTRCVYRDRYGRVHHGWCWAPPGGAAVNEAPAPIPSPHVYWRG